jgi:dipeptidase E
MDAVQILLLSNSTQFGRGYLDHCAEALAQFLEGVDRLLFVPYALHDRDAYARMAADRFARLGVKVHSVHQEADPASAARSARAIFIGGGNTFRLLNELYANGLIAALKEAVRGGARYLGSSAGSNVAGPTIQTTNDMPIVYPPSFRALGLVPFNLNPHYFDPPAESRHMGETREQRIAEFHQMNAEPVVGLREGAWLRGDGGSVRLEGVGGARLFRRGQEPFELPAGAEIAEWVRPAPRDPGRGSA